VIEDDAVAPVHLFVDGQELVLGHRPITRRDVHVHADHAQLINAPLDLAERGVDVGQGQRDEGLELVRVRATSSA
jgi:hypothetical protein